jgi:hypothetical protein
VDRDAIAVNLKKIAWLLVDQCICTGAILAGVAARAALAWFNDRNVVVLAPRVVFIIQKS